MKKRINLISETVKIVLNCLIGALYFIKLYSQTAVLPNAEGGIDQVEYWYSIYDKLLRENLQFLVFLALAVTAISVLVSVFTLIAKENNRKRAIASYVVFAASAVFFLVLFLCTAQIRYGF